MNTKPCPFCGELSILEHPVDPGDGTVYLMLTHSCPVVGLIGVSWIKDQSDVDKHWNARAILDNPKTLL